VGDLPIAYLETWIIEPCAMLLGFPLSLRSRKVVPLSLKGERRCISAVFFAPFPEKGVLDFIAHG